MHEASRLMAHVDPIADNRRYCIIIYRRFLSSFGSEGVGI